MAQSASLRRSNSRRSKFTIYTILPKHILTIIPRRQHSSRQSTSRHRESRREQSAAPVAAATPAYYAPNSSSYYYPYAHYYSTREHSLRTRQVPTIQIETYAPPSGNYYLDLCAVRTATNRALQATIAETTRPSRSSGNKQLRRRAGYTRLRE
jgi:hypothetical protein